MILEDITAGFYVKSRPDQYEASDAAYATGGNSGYVLSQKPGDYDNTPQQNAVKDAAQKCGIKKGISKKELQNKMVDCVGPEMRKWGENNNYDILEEE